MERREKDSFAKRFYVGECAGSRSVGRPRERWIDTVKESLRKRGLDVRQARRMVHIYMKPVGGNFCGRATT